MSKPNSIEEALMQEIFSLTPEVVASIVRLNEIFKCCEKLYENLPPHNTELGNAIINHPEVGQDSQGCKAALQSLGAVAKQGIDGFNLLEGLLLQLRDSYVAGLQNVEMFHSLLVNDRKRFEDYRDMLEGLEVMRQQVTGESMN